MEVIEKIERMALWPKGNGTIETVESARAEILDNLKLLTPSVEGEDKQ